MKTVCEILEAAGKTTVDTYYNFIGHLGLVPEAGDVVVAADGQSLICSAVNVAEDGMIVCEFENGQTVYGQWLAQKSAAGIFTVIKPAL